MTHYKIFKGDFFMGNSYAETSEAAISAVQKNRSDWRKFTGSTEAMPGDGKDCCCQKENGDSPCPVHTKI